MRRGVPNEVMDAISEPPYDTFFAYESTRYREDLVANGVIGTTQYSDTMFLFLREMSTANLIGPACAVSGPHFVTKTIKKHQLSPIPTSHLAQPGRRYDLVILPSVAFYPLHIVDIHNARVEHRPLKTDEEIKMLYGSYMNQHWSTTFSS